MTTNQNISDLLFIGSGISTTFTIIHLLERLETDSDVNRNLSITIIDKYSEFNTGIPYGKRSGYSTLLITSLKNFLPEPELSKFIKWLNINKSWLLKEYRNEGGVLSKQWLEINREDIENNNWEDLFIPRRFFGSYIDEKINNKIKKLSVSGKVSVNFVQGAVTNLDKNQGVFIVSLSEGKTILSHKVILSTGSLPVNNLWKNKKTIKKKELLFINRSYDPSIKSTLKKVKKFADKRKNKETNVLIVGANASALELLYKLNDIYSIDNDVINNFVFLSTQGRAPDAVIDKKRQKEFKPVNLLGLKDETSLTADIIAEATFKDIEISDKIKLGAASTVDTISAAFGTLLEKLNHKELEKFACNYGNEIGKKQRCAGEHYSNTIKKLKAMNRFEHISGRFNNIDKRNDSYYLQYKDTETGDIKEYTKPFNIVFNCIGGKNLSHSDIPDIIKNLIEKDFCTPNESNIGFHVNDKLESHDNLHIMGPLLAGNVIENRAVWHVEHCGRIIWLSKKLSKILHDNYLETQLKTKASAIVEPKLEVITNKKDWDDCLNHCKKYDFYHTYDYHNLSKVDSEEPVLLKYTENDTCIALPLLIRNISGTNYKDATSVYGYVGPLSNDIPSHFDNTNFKKSLAAFFESNNIISVFSRLNPYINHQSQVLDGFGDIIKQGKIVNIDLNLSVNEQRKNYRSRLKTHVNKARRHCSIKVSKSEKDLQKFMELYRENMDRVNAKKFYYFSDSYFTNLLNSENFNTKILSVVDNASGEVIGASMFISADSILHYHLSGSKEEFLHLTPTKLLIDEMRILAANEGYTFFNLGGGLGGRDDDSLFHFKSSFSKDFKEFNLWKYIANKKVYDDLVKIKKTNHESNFFPNYRANEKTS